MTEVELDDSSIASNNSDISNLTMEVREKQVTAFVKTNHDYAIKLQQNGYTQIIWKTKTPAIITDAVRFKFSHFMKKNEFDELLVHTEIKHKDLIYRAHPNYRGGDPWYDWCMVRYDLSSDDHQRKEENEHLGINTAYPVGHYPAKILAFFMNLNKIHCLIHCCESKKTSVKDSCLTECWNLEYEKIKNDNRIKLRICSMDCIEDRIFVVEECSGVHYMKGVKSSKIILVKKRSMWAPYFTDTS